MILTNVTQSPPTATLFDQDWKIKNKEEKGMPSLLCYITCCCALLHCFLLAELRSYRVWVPQRHVFDDNIVKQPVEHFNLDNFQPLAKWCTSRWLLTRPKRDNVIVGSCSVRAESIRVPRKSPIGRDILLLLILHIQSFSSTSHSNASSTA